MENSYNPPQTAFLTYAGAVTAAGVGMLALALWFGGGRPQPALPGLPSPGAVTTWGLPLTRLVLDVCATATVGILLAAVVLTPGLAEPARTTIARAARWWALAWAAAAALTFLLTLSDFVALPVRQALASGALTAFTWSIPQGRAFVVVTALALLIAAGCATLRPPAEPAARRAARWRAVLLAAAVFTVLPPAYVGHSASAADHNLAVSSLMLHIAGAAVWVGGLLALLAYARDAPDLGRAVHRFSALALCCFVAVAASGLLNAWIRLDPLSLLWQSRYGLLILGKLAALLILGWFGWIHRKATITHLPAAPGGEAGERAGARGPFLRLAAGEVAVMAVTIGLAVALSRTPPPTAEQAAHTHDELGYTLPPFQPARLLTELRPDPIVLLPLVLAAALYLLGVYRFHRLGQGGWPLGRTAAWLAGLLVLAYALAGGVGAYAPAIFTVSAVQYALAGFVAPALLVSAAPLTLALAATTPSSPFGDVPRLLADSPLTRALTHPGATLCALAAPYLLLYPAGLLGDVQPIYALRLVTQAVIVATGVLFFAVVVGADPLPRPAPMTIRLQLSGAAIVVQAALSLFLLAGPLQAESWYVYLSLPGAPGLSTAQKLGALLPPALTVATLATLTTALLHRQHKATRRITPTP